MKHLETSALERYIKVNSFSCSHRKKLEITDANSDSFHLFRLGEVRDASTMDIFAEAVPM